MLLLTGESSSLLVTPLGVQKFRLYNQRAYPLFCYCCWAKVLPCLPLPRGYRRSGFTTRGPTYPLFCYCCLAKVLPCLPHLLGSRSSGFTIRGPTLCSVTAAWQRFFPACHSSGGPGVPGFALRRLYPLFCYCCLAKVLPCLSLLLGSRSSGFTIRGLVPFVLGPSILLGPGPNE